MVETKSWYISRQIGVSCVRGEGGGGDDEDGGVDEDGDDGEGDAEFGDGEGHARFDGFEGGPVVVEGGGAGGGSVFVVALMFHVEISPVPGRSRGRWYGALGFLLGLHSFDTNLGEKVS